MNTEYLNDYPLLKPTQGLEIFTHLSHEVRTPLNVIIGVTELLQKKESQSNKDEYYKILESASGNLLELVNNILDYSKLESGNIKVAARPFHLQQTLEQSLFAHSQMSKSKGLDFSLEIDSRLPEVLIGDQVKLTQIFINLISNSIKFTEKAKIQVSVEILEEIPDAFLVLCKVNDTGIGIPNNQLENIFEAFNQGEAGVNITYAGTGLGLNITRDLVKLLGGNLKVRSKVGNGSSFEFSLQLGKTLRSLKISEKVERMDAGRLKGKKILLVEDNKLNVLVASRFLDLWEIDYEIAANGEEALVIVEKLNFDIILMDLQMPVMNGEECTRHIRKLQKGRYNNLPVIALTAALDDAETRIRLGPLFNDFLQKPFKSEDLFELLLVNCN